MRNALRSEDSLKTERRARTPLGTAAHCALRIAGASGHFTPRAVPYPGVTDTSTRLYTSS